MNEFEVLIEKILGYFAGPQFRDELHRAKVEFFGNVAWLEENSVQYELRMSQFYDWYFFSRELEGYGLTPLESCHMVRELRFSEEDNRLINQLKQHRHSIFEFLKIKNDDIYIKDLLKNQKLIVRKSPWVYGFDSKEFFEARLVPVKDSFIFTKGLCFHPESAQKYILSEAKRHRKDPDLDPERLMLQLIKMRYKFEQYKHVNPELIYSNESKLLQKR